MCGLQNITAARLLNMILFCLKRQHGAFNFSYFDAKTYVIPSKDNNNSVEGGVSTVRALSRNRAKAENLTKAYTTEKSFLGLASASPFSV